jgi:hypothetical protein
MQSGPKVMGGFESGVKAQKLREKSLKTRPTESEASAEPSPPRMLHCSVLFCSHARSFSGKSRAFQGVVWATEALAHCMGFFLSPRMHSPLNKMLLEGLRRLRSDLYIVAYIRVLNNTGGWAEPKAHVCLSSLPAGSGAADDSDDIDANRRRFLERQRTKGKGGSFAKKPPAPVPAGVETLYANRATLQQFGTFT